LGFIIFISIGRFLFKFIFSLSFDIQVLNQILKHMRINRNTFIGLCELTLQ